MEMRVSSDAYALLSPPLKKGGRGDLLLLSAKAKQKQIPPSIALRSPIPALAHSARALIGARGNASQTRLFAPFFKGGNSNDRRQPEFPGWHA